MYYITVIHGCENGKFVELQEGIKIFIGKEKDNDLQLSDPGISRKHCCLWLENQQVWIQDLGSSNGTLIKKGHVGEKDQLFANDFIMIGLAKLQLQEKHPLKTPSDLHTTKTDPDIVYRKRKKTPTFSQSSASEKDLMFLYSMGKLIFHQLEIPTLVNSLLQNTVRMLNIERCCVALKLSFLSNQNNLDITYCTQEKEETLSFEKFPLNQFILDTALLKNEGTISNKSKTNQTVSTLCVPLQGSNRAFGVFYLESVSKTFKQKDLDLLTAVGRQLAFALEKSFLEKQLIASEQHSIIEHSRDVIYRHKMDFSFSIISASIKSLLGFSCDEIYNDGKTWEKCVYPEDKELFYSKLEKVFLGEECTVEYRMKRKDGEIIWVEETSYPVKDQKGNFVCVQGLAKNITERKLLQEKLEQTKKVENMGTVAAGVAHDLNNLLGGLFGYPDLIIRGLPENSPLINYVNHMKTSSILASEVVKDLLLLGKKEQEELVILDLNVLVSNYLQSTTFNNLQNLYPNVKIVTKLTQTFLPISGVHKHLEKIILNLVVNGFDAMSQSGGTLEISTSWECLDQKEYAVLKISDTAKGIKEKDLKRIFEPFYSKKIYKRGSGLCLAVVYKLVQDNLGHIDVKSELDTGTIYKTYFPTKKKETKSETSNLAEGKETILLVDDVLAQRVLGNDFLTSLGYKVISVASGEEAIDYFKKNKVDLVLLDMILEGGIDGLETYKQILKISPGQKAIIISGYSCTQKIKEALALGAGAYIPKPYSLDKLAVTVHKELNKA